MPTGARPTGSVTFLFTDIEGSTQLWDTVPASMARALEQHDAILNRAIAAHGGTVFATGGDGFCVAFNSARQAIEAASSAQRELGLHPWPPGCTLRVRMGMHSGEAVERGGDYFGPAVNLAARVMAAAHGGQIVCTDIVAELSAGSATTQSLGEHDLRGVSAAVRIHQVLGAGLATEFGPLRTLESVPTNLPSELIAPVGRTAVISQIIDIAADGRLVTLTGVGGVGKTTVALSAGRQLLAGTKQGVWLVELAAVTQPDQVLEAIAAALRFPPPGGVPLRAALSEFLERRELILVLDNCEHIVEAVADVVQWLLQSCPSVSVLATSREALRIPAEQVVMIPPLQVPEGDAPNDVRSSPAGELFCVRAEAAGATWRLEGDEARAVADLCRSLDGIPLALELAASRSAQLSVSDIVARLGSRLEILSRSRRTGEARHQTLVATLEWSYELLETSEKQLLRLLSTFAGGFDIGAVVRLAETIGLEEWPALDALSSLVAKSLVEQDTTSTGRYRLLETVRAYAASLGAADERAAAAEAHADYYLGLTRAAFLDLRTTDGVEATERLAADSANLEVALTWCLATARTDLALELFELPPMMLLTTMPAKVTDAIVRPLEKMILARGAENQKGFTAAVATAAQILMEDPDSSRLRRIVEANTRTSPDAFTTSAIAVNCAVTGDMATGAAEMAAALARMGADDDPLLRSSLLAQLGIFELGVDPIAAQSHAEAALALARTHGGEAVRLYPLLAVAVCSQANAARSAEAAREAVLIDRTVRRTYSSIASTLAAHAAAGAGDTASAVPLLRHSLALMAQQGSRTMLSITVGAAADAIAGIAPDAAIALACLAESDAITAVATLSNANYAELCSLAARRDPDALQALRDEYSRLDYQDAVSVALTILDTIAADVLRR